MTYLDTTLYSHGNYNAAFNNIPRASKEWNLIPKEIRELPPRKFKKELRKYLLGKQTEGTDFNFAIYNM